MTVTSGPLDGVSTLVTRPRHQADNLCAQLSAAGADVVRFPVLEIVPLAPTPVLEAGLDRIDEQQLLVFTSVNAVTMLMELLASRGRRFPRSVLCAAVGVSTGEALERAGAGEVLIAPPPCNSEALLALPQLQDLRGTAAMLITGEGGRGLLEPSLRGRGAEITRLDVYRRVLPDTDPAILRSWLQRTQPCIVLITSVDALDNLLQLAGKDWRERLLERDLVTIAPRIAEAAGQRGWRGTITVTRPFDAAVVQGIVGWWQQARKRMHS